ncbi:hypothetical protein WA171_001012 [Blastocystis sp. BT1]
MSSIKSSQIDNLKQRLDRLYSQIGVKGDLFDSLLQQVQQIRNDYTQLCSVSGIDDYYKLYNNVGKVIYLDGVANQFDVGTNATSMKEYAQQMKYPLEEATITLQSLQQLGEELKQIPLPNIQEIRKRVDGLKERIALVEVQLYSLHNDICSIVAEYTHSVEIKSGCDCR